MLAAGVPTGVVLPVKRLDDAKLRLSDLLSPAQRRALMTAMLGDVLDAVASVGMAHDLLVVTSDADAARAARGHGARVLGDAGHAGHSAASALGIRAAAARGARRVLSIAGDCPLTAPDELAALLWLPAAPHGRVVVVPDSDGAGTNALLVEPPEAIEPSFGPGSHDRHRSLARSAGVPVVTRRLPSLALDVDTPADLRVVAGLLAREPHRAPRTAALVAELPPARAAA